MSDPQPAGRPPLNPFVFPSETRARFKMLTAAALVLTWSFAAALVPVPGVFTNVLSGDELAKISFDPAFLSRFPDGRVEDFSFLVPDNAWKTLRLYGVRPVLALFLVSGVVALGLAGYLLHPRLRRRALGSRPLTEAEAPELTREIRRLAEQCGVSKRLELEWAPGMLDGLAVGPPWRRILVYRVLPAALGLPLGELGRAVVLHELGHLANRDVGLRELSRALWVGVAAVALLVAAAGAVLGPGPPSSWFFFVLRLAGVCGAAWLIWWGLVRVREHYADWRVVAWNGKEALLRRLGLPSGSRFMPGHPENAARAEALCDETSLFRITPDLPFVTGLLLAVVAFHVGPLIRDLAMIYLPVMGSFYFSIRDAAGPLSPISVLVSALYFYLFPALLLSAVLVRLTAWVSGALGVQVQREAVADFAVRGSFEWRYLPLWNAALVFALGFEAGSLLAPGVGFGVPGLGRLAWFAGFTGLAWIWLVYVRVLSRLLLGTCAGARPPRLRRAFVGGSAAVLLAVLFWPASYARVSMTATAWLNPWGFDSNQVAFTFISGGILVLLGAAVFLYVVFVGLAVVVTASWLAFRRLRCSGCGTAIRPRFTVGRSCPNCARPFSAWACLKPDLAEV